MQLWNERNKVTRMAVMSPETSEGGIEDTSHPSRELAPLLMLSSGAINDGNRKSGQ